jgi:hypothetical protein
LLAVLPSEELQHYETQVDEIISDKRVVSIWEAEAALNCSGTVTSDKYGPVASSGRVFEMPLGSRAWRNFDVVKGSEYRVAVKIQGNAVVKVDEQVYSVSSPELDFVYLGPIYLGKGEHSIEVDPVGDKLDLDVIWLYTTEKEDETIDDIFVPEHDAAQITNFTKIDPTKYMVRVSAEQPFMLSFAEAYDRLWVARVNGREYRSVPLNSVVNGFWIEDTGDLEITIEFKPQTWFCWGVAISIIGQVGALAFVLWDWRRKRK